MATGIGASGVICWRTYRDEWYRVDLESLPEEGEVLSPIARLEHENFVNWTTIGEDIYCSGGTVFFPEVNQQALSNTLYKHDPTSKPDDWQLISRDRKFPHYRPFVFAINRKIYVIGGLNLNYKVTRSDPDSEDRPEEFPYDQWTYGGEVYDLDTQTWNGVASTWEQFTDFCGAPAARLDKDRVVFYATPLSSLLFYDAANDELSSEFHPDFNIDTDPLPEFLRESRYRYALSHSTRRIPAVVYQSTLYWLAADLHLYGYDIFKRRWFRSKDGLEETSWPIWCNSDHILALPVLINLDDKGTFLAIFASDCCKLGIASFAVHKDGYSLTVSLKATRTLTVPRACHPYQAMLMKQMGKKGEEQFRWTKPMEYLMLEILADEVKQGNKSNSQFKATSFNRVAKAINQQLGVECSPNHIEDHLKTIKNTWNTVQTLLNKSDFEWNDKFNMITASPSVYAAHIQAHPAHEKFINKKIDMFEEMSLVCGNDRAKGDCAKSFDNVNLNSSSEKGNNDGIQGPSNEKDVQEVVSETPQVKTSQKQSCSDVQDMFGDILSKLGEVATAISKIADTRLDVNKLYEEVMSMEGYERVFLSEAFDYLVPRDSLARSFMAKSLDLRKLWLDKFKREHYDMQNLKNK